MKRVIVTGACGFIGTCLSQRLMDHGIFVIGIDNLSRKGTEFNLQELAGPLFTLHRVDLSHAQKVMELMSSIGSVDALFHLAGQTAVTTSYRDRQQDFLDNALASFNVIEAVRRFTPEAYCLYASTNKVYGNIQVAKPVGFDYPLEAYTPYGVSKATGEMYFTEYGRPENGLTTCSLRQSCIYGHHQYGIEDQGWVAWFVIANLLDLPVTIYGKGEQIRDLLFIDDLVDLYLECWDKRLSGVFPTGGGPGNTISLLQGIELIVEVTGKQFSSLAYREARPGDQSYFVADLSWKDKVGIGWQPKTKIAEGTQTLAAWVASNAARIRKVLSL